MISFDEAAAIVANVARPIGTEPIAIGEAQGRRLAEPAVAALSSPPRAVSVMDGYAVREADLATLPVRLPIAQEIFAGAPDPAPLAAGTCARIFTGAPVPAGPDRVIVQEVVERDGDHALFAQPLSPSRHIRPTGSDFTAGATLLEAGRSLGPRELVAVAAGDLAEVICWKRPRVAILATGDELAPPGTARDKAGSIPESISAGVAAMVRDHGGEVVGIQRLADTLEAMEAAAGEVLGMADLVVVTGGASVGERDYAQRMFHPHGLSLHLSKVAMKPGKPVWLGQCGGALVMGLPGNPTSAMVTGRLLLAPLVAGLAGGDPLSAWQWEDRPLAGPLDACGDRETFARAASEGDGVRPIDNQDSGSQGSLAEADWLVRVRPQSPARMAGDTVEAIRF